MGKISKAYTKKAKDKIRQKHTKSKMTEIIPLKTYF